MLFRGSAWFQEATFALVFVVSCCVPTSLDGQEKRFAFGDCVALLGSQVGRVDVLEESIELRGVIADGTISRVRVSCPGGRLIASDGVLEYPAQSGVSEFLQLEAAGSGELKGFSFAVEREVPVALSVTAPRSTLREVGETIQLMTVCRLRDGSSEQCSSSSDGTSYRASSEEVCTVSRDGEVIAAGSGLCIVTVSRDGLVGGVGIEVIVGRDSDGDGLPDDFETANQLDPNDPSDAAADLDGDGLSNAEEFGLGTDLLVADTDGDGLSDSEERPIGTIATSPDSDLDGLLDGDEVALGSDPLNPDSDSDGLPDGLEVALSGSPTDANPFADSDGDGLSNREEVELFTDPGNPDTDGDGLLDGQEMLIGTDPLETSDDAVVDGLTLSLSRKVTVESLTLINGGAVTQAPSTTTSTRLLEIDAARIEVDGTSRIDASGAGFLGARRGANSGFVGRTLGNTTQGGSGPRNGGSYAGRGAGATPNAVYGEYRNPLEPGSGGGTSGSPNNFPGGSGGGVVRISAGTALLDGLIAADGQDANGGAGSGGAIRLDVGTLSGSGSIRARGGDGPAGGGGGRVAIYYTDAAGFDFSRVDAGGGAGAGNGGAGTVFLKAEDEAIGQLVIGGSGGLTPWLGNLTRDEVALTLRDQARVLASELSVDSLTLLGDSAIFAPAATTESVSPLRLEVGSLEVDATSRIDTTGAGFLGARQGANSGFVGRTVGNTTEGGSGPRNGGSHGGRGAGTAPNAVYGDFRDPVEPGSGGGTSGAPNNFRGGSGGGVVWISADTAVVDGLIAADGQSESGGGGSGGAIRLDVGTLAGSGSILARGGNGSAGGGGGRVAIYYADAAGFDFSGVNPGGGMGGGNGGAGTVFLKAEDQAIGQLIIGGSGGLTPWLGNLTRDEVALTLRDQARVLASELSVDSLTLLDGSVLLAQAATTETVSPLMLEVGSLAVDGTSRIDASGTGFLGARQGANSGFVGRTLGNTTEGGSGPRNGGSYGGRGAGTTPNAVYGDYRNPLEPGSGGGTNGSPNNFPGGSGGGVVRISADTAVLDGLIAADGQAASGGAGSGGAIRLDVGTFSGLGSIRARGGDGSSGGGGGRVAIYYGDAAGFDFSRVEAGGGVGGGNGGAGTIFFKADSQAFGDLVIDNQGSSTSGFSTPLRGIGPGLSTGLLPESLTDVSRSFALPEASSGALGLVGLELNPNTAQGQTFTVIDNTVDSLFTDAGDGDMTGVAMVGDGYVGVYFLDSLFVINGAQVTTPDNIEAGEVTVDASSRLEANNLSLP